MRILKTARLYKEMKTMWPLIWNHLSKNAKKMWPNKTISKLEPVLKNNTEVPIKTYQ